MIVFDFDLELEMTQTLISNHDINRVITQSEFKFNWESSLGIIFSLLSIEIKPRHVPSRMNLLGMKFNL